MKRVVQVLIFALPIALLNGPLTAVARADCADELRALRERLAAVTDEPRRQELERLIEKAEKDAKAGRTGLCDEAVERGRALLN
jgi:hypothetical protein